MKAGQHWDGLVPPNFEKMLVVLPFIGLPKYPADQPLWARYETKESRMLARDIQIAGFGRRVAQRQPSHTFVSQRRCAICIDTYIMLPSRQCTGEADN